MCTAYGNVCVSKTVACIWKFPCFQPYQEKFWKATDLGWTKMPRPCFYSSISLWVKGAASTPDTTRHLGNTIQKLTKVKWKRIPKENSLQILYSELVLMELFVTNRALIQDNSKVPLHVWEQLLEEWLIQKSLCTHTPYVVHITCVCHMNVWP